MRDQGLRVGSKKSTQQGRSHFSARSVHAVHEHGKMARTPLMAFFNRPRLVAKQIAMGNVQALSQMDPISWEFIR